MSDKFNEGLQVSGDLNQSVVGWTQEGEVVWLYRTHSGDIALMRMSPSVARKCAKNFTAIDADIRESLNDCSYSAGRLGDVDEDLCERTLVHARENPNMRTLGISMEWGDFAKIVGAKGYPTYETPKPILMKNSKPD
jgi:hypothetical protein